MGVIPLSCAHDFVGRGSPSKEVVFMGFLPPVLSLQLSSKLPRPWHSGSPFTCRVDR